MGSRKESWHPDIDFEAPFDLAENFSLDAPCLIESRFQIFPDFQVLGALTRNNDAAAFTLFGFKIDIDVITDLDLKVTLPIHELLDRGLALRLIANVDQDMGGGNPHDSTFNYSTGLYRAQALFEHRLKFASAACRCALFVIHFSHENQLRSI